MRSSRGRPRPERDSALIHSLSPAFPLPITIPSYRYTRLITDKEVRRGGPVTMSGADDFPIRGLLEVGRGLVAGLDTRTILDRLLAAARELTGAQYAALR